MKLTWFIDWGETELKNQSVQMVNTYYSSIENMLHAIIALKSVAKIFNLQRADRMWMRSWVSNLRKHQRSISSMHKILCFVFYKITTGLFSIRIYIRRLSSIYQLLTT